MSAFLDDGTGNIRCTFWKTQALRLTRKAEHEFAAFRDDPAQFEDVKNDLLGEFVKVTGRVRRNETFDRLELTANTVTTDIDPAKELANLEQKFSASAPSVVAEKVVVRDAEKGVSVSEEMRVIEDDVISLDDMDDVEK